MNYFLENLPYFIFILALCVIFVLFLFGGFLLLSAGGEKQKTEKGRKFLLNSLYGLFTLLLIILVFFLVTYLLQRGDVLRPLPIPGEFPPSPAASFPPPPQFIEIGRYSFSGTWSLKENNFIGKPAIYSILCKKNGEYDIMDIERTEGRVQLLEQEQYGCWLENCEQKLKNLYLAIFLTPPDKYDPARKEKIKEELKKQINPPCPVEKI